MKVLIVFFAMLILNTIFLAYQSDMNRYIIQQKKLKFLSEECASGAALYFNEEGFSNGKLIANEMEGMKYIEYTIRENVGQRRIDYNVHFFDERGEWTYPFSFQKEDGRVVKVEHPSVVVTIREKRNDFFRMPFLSEKEVVGDTLYEIKER